MDKSDLQILLVEDNPADVLFLRDALTQDAQANFHLTVVESLGDALNLLAAQTFAAALLDLGLSDSQGLSTFLSLHRTVPDLPVVVLSALDSEEIAMQAMQAGAQDYLVKRPRDYPSAGRALRYAIERQKTRAELRASEARYHGTLEAMQEGVLLIGWDWRYLYINKSAEAQGRRPAAELLEKTVTECWPGIEATDFFQLEEQVMQERQPAHIERPFTFPDGETRWFHWNIQPAPEGLLVVTQDITERKQAENALEQTRNTLADAQKVAHMGSFEYIAATQTTVWSEEEFRIYGLDPAGQSPAYAEMLQKSIHPDDAVLLNDLFTEALQHGTVYELEHRIVRPDGSVRWVYDRAQPYYDEHGKIERYVGITLDITERKQAEKEREEARNALQQERQLLRTLIDNLPDYIYMKDTQGRFLIANQATADLKGVASPEQLLGKTDLDFYPKDTASRYWEREQRIMQSGETLYNHEEPQLDMEGQERWLSTTKLALHDLQGQVIGLVGIERDVTARRQAVEAQAKTDALLHTVLNNAPITIFAIDRQGRFTLSEGKGLERVGLKPGENVGVPVLDLYESLTYVEHNGNRTNGKAILQRALSGETLGAVNELRGIHFDNYFAPVYDTEGQVSGVVGVATDITERRRAELELRASEARFSNMFHNSPTGIILTRLSDGSILDVNDAYANMLGYTRDEMVGRTTLDLGIWREPDARARVNETLQSDGRVRDLEVAMQTRSGELRSVIASAEWIELNGEMCIQSSVIDITVRKHAEQSLRQSNEQYRQLSEELEERVRQRTAEVRDLYDSAPAGYHSLDQDGIVTQINQTELNWLGYTRAEILGRHFSEFITASSQEVFSENFALLKREGQLHNVEFEFVRKNGSTFPALINSVAVRNADGDFVQCRTTVFDNTERKEAEKAIREREAQLRLSRDKLSAANAALEKAARMKDEFLANMSHELRTPLTGILGMSEVLQLTAYGPLTEKQAKAVRSIEKSGRHLLELINDILDLSKIESGMLGLNIEPVALSDVCQASLQLTKEMANKKQQSVHFSMEPPAICIRADARRLKQMLVNLLSNAIKFTAESGSLGLDVQADERAEMVRLTVWDTGIGIEPEDMEQLFQPFVQLDSSLSRQHEGTGLGLSLVHRMAELHGGSVEVESTPGQGSRFTIMLPWQPEGSQSAPASRTSSVSLRKALVIEEIKIDAELLTSYLHRLGMEVVVHEAGQGIVERAAQENPDVILLDLRLPDRSGLDVLLELQGHPATYAIPVICCSVEERRSQALTLGADGYLIKPLSLPELRTELSKAAHALAQTSNTAPPPDTSQPLALIVDDNEMVVEALSVYLESQNFRVAAARSGAESLNIVSELRPDIILMDIQMPVMDGLEATRRIRAHPDARVSQTPIVALTALAMSGDRERCLAAGANAYLSKPVNLKQLLKMVDELTTAATPLP